MRVVPSMLVLFALAVACGGGGTEPSNAGGGGGGGNTCPSTTTSVGVIDNAYQPNCTTVPVGATVTWTWSGVNEHTVTFNNTSLGGSPQQLTGTHTHTFSGAGTFAYHCQVHTGMTGQVRVQ